MKKINVAAAIITKNNKYLGMLHIHDIINAGL